MRLTFACGRGTGALSLACWGGKHSAWWSWRLVSQDGYSSTFSTMFLLDTFGFISSFLLQIVPRYYGLLASKFDCFWQGARTRRRRGRAATVGPCSTWLGSERTWFDVGMIWWIYGDYGDMDFFVIPSPHHPYHRRSPCDVMRGLYTFFLPKAVETHIVILWLQLSVDIEATRKTPLY